MPDYDPAALPGDGLVRGLARPCVRTGLAITALPLVQAHLAGQRFGAMCRHRLPVGPPRPAPPHPGRGPLPLARVVDEIRAVPFSPRLGGTMRSRFGGMADLPLLLLSGRVPFAGISFAYPRSFVRQVVMSGDEPISCLVGRHGDARPAVVIVHGAMTTSGFDYVRRAAVRLFGGGFDVVAMDQRGFGQTWMTSRAPASFGWEEGGDVLAIARWLRLTGATSVGAIGYSLGGSAVLAAARRSGYASGLDGGVIAWSAPADMERALRHVSTRPANRRDPFYATYLSLRIAATARVRSLGLTLREVSPWEAAALLCGAYYGLSLEELAARSSASSYAAGITVPVLAVHARNDAVVPVDHARLLQSAAAGNPLVVSLVLDQGGHTGFELVDPEWVVTTERIWFGGLAATPDAVPGWRRTGNRA